MVYTCETSRQLADLIGVETKERVVHANTSMFSTCCTYIPVEPDSQAFGILDIDLRG